MKVLIFINLLAMNLASLCLASPSYYLVESQVIEMGKPETLETGIAIAIEDLDAQTPYYCDVVLKKIPYFDFRQNLCGEYDFDNGRFTFSEDQDEFEVADFTRDTPGSQSYHAKLNNGWSYAGQTILAGPGHIEAATNIPGTFTQIAVSPEGVHYQITGYYIPISHEVYQQLLKSAE